MNITPAVKNFVLQRGDTFSYTFDITIDNNGVEEVFDVTGGQAFAQLREDFDTASPLILDFTVTINDPTNEITFALSAPQTATVEKSEGCYDVLFIDSTGDETHFLRGQMVFTGTATEAPPSTATILAPVEDTPGNFTVTVSTTTGVARTIANVKLYVDDVLLATDSTAPYTFSWSSVAAGDYVLTAVITDDKGSYSSAPYEITVS